MKRLMLFLMFGFLVADCLAQKVNYAVKDIPTDLLKNANAVLRTDETKISIIDPGNITIYHKYAITILNEGGDSKAEFETYYDKFRSVESVEGNLFDANGTKIRSMKKSDLQDYGSVGDFELISDSRVKVHDFYSNDYPYTVEYITETKAKTAFDLPHWIPINCEKFAVQNSSFYVECPLEYQLYYKVFNYKEIFVADTVNHIKRYSWGIKNVNSFIEEQHQPEWYELTPSVFLSPSDFEMQGFKGNMSSWKSFGKFMYTLNQGNDELPDNIKKIVHSLIDTVSDAHKKIEILYKYLQMSTRYVAIELGIGGWQAFDANYVATKGYGDCKALSNYMHALLKEAGIKSDCILIKSGYGRTSLISDFPSNQFDHEITCVPLNADTVWLECTSQTLPAGYLSGFTSNRDALLFDEDGGKLVHTPDYTIKDNQQIRNIKAIVDSEGFLHASIKTKYVGQKQDEWEWRVNALSKDKMMEYLKQKYADIPSYDIVKYNYDTTMRGQLPVMNEAIELTANNYASVSGTRIFINPNILTHSKDRLDDFNQRTCDIVLQDGFTDIDSVDLILPPGYAIESLPIKVDITSKFGHYLSYVNVSADKIVYYRYYEQVSGIFPVSDSLEFAYFLKRIYKADYSRLVLIKRT